jgi:hypothetical protein
MYRIRDWEIKPSLEGCEMLLGTERAKGGQPYQKSTSTKCEPVELTLSDLGISKKQSSEAQISAKMPEPTPTSTAELLASIFPSHKSFILKLIIFFLSLQRILIKCV